MFLRRGALGLRGRIVGAVLGGWLFTLLTGQPGVTGLNLGSIIVAFIGACILIAILRAVSSRTAV